MSYIMQENAKAATVIVNGELEVVFPYNYNSVAVRSTSDIGVSPLPGKQIGEDSVLKCIANSSIVYPLFVPQDRIYLIGTGTVEIFIGNDLRINPFEAGVGSGGGSPSSDVDYNNLINKPKINGVEVIGSKSLDDYGIQMLSQEQLTALLNKLNV